MTETTETDNRIFSLLVGAVTLELAINTFHKTICDNNKDKPSINIILSRTIRITSCMAVGIIGIAFIAVGLSPRE